MKNLIITTVVFAVCIFLTGCNSDDEPAADYYVRYTAIAKPNATVSMSFSSEAGKARYIQTSMPDGKFQYCVGPVRKGFKADIVVSYDAGGPVDYLSIEVAQGAMPFVLKKSGTNYYDLEYTIE